MVPLERSFIDRAVAAKKPLVAMSAEGNPQRVSMPVQTGIRWATLIATLDWTAIQRDILEREKRISVTVLVLALIALLTLLLSINRWVLTPVVKVAKVAEKFAEGDLGAQIHLEGAGGIRVWHVF